MDVNEFTASGLLNGDITETEREGGKTFTLSLKSTNPNAPSPTEDFMCVVYGKAAEALSNANVRSGSRMIVQGRLASEKVGEIYHSVLSVTRVLGVLEDSSQGTDFARAFLGGTATATKLNELQSGSAVASLNIVNNRSFNRKDGSEVNIRTFSRATLWNDLARSIDYPMSDTEVIVEGALKPSEYEGAAKIEVWADTLTFVGQRVSGEAGSAPAPAAPAQQPARASRPSVQEDDPFS